MYCSSEISCKIRTLSFWATIAVVIIHSNPLENKVSCPWAWWVGNIIGVLQYWAVPYFFIVSGFFFDKSYGMQDVPMSKFLRGKIRSLGVPYLLWGAIFGGVVLTSLMIFANANSQQPIIANTIFDTASPVFAADKLIGFSRGSPMNGALWYVRLLLAIFCFAPILKWIRNMRQGGGGGVLLCISILIIANTSAINEGRVCESLTIYGVPIEIKLAGVGYFIMGMVASKYSIEKMRLTPSLRVVFIATWICGMISALILRYNGVPLGHAGELFFRFSPLLFIAVLWSISWRCSKFVSSLIPFRFWIYCMHHPVTACVAAVSHQVLGRSIGIDFLRMLLITPTSLAIVTFAGVFVRQRYNKLFAVLNGGR